MEITNNIRTGLQRQFPEAASDPDIGRDQERLAELIGGPVEVEIERIDQVNAVQNTVLARIADEFNFLKRQVDAIIRRTTVPTRPGSAGTGVTTTIPQVPGELSPIPPVRPDGSPLPPSQSGTPTITSPTGPLQSGLQYVQVVAGVATARIMAGQTQYLLVEDPTARLVEDTIQLAIQTISSGLTQVLRPQSFAQSLMTTSRSRTLYDAVDLTIRNLRQNGYLRD